MKKPIIGMILDKSFPPDPRVENEAMSLIKNGFEVHLFCITFSKEKKEPEQQNHNGIQVFRVFERNLTYRISALAYTFPFYHIILEKWLKKFIEQVQPDYLHVHDIQPAKAVFNVNKKFKLPITLDLHENVPEIMKYYSHVQTFPGSILIDPKKWKKNEFNLIKQADQVVTVTQEAAEYYQTNIPISSSKFKVVPNTVHPSFWENLIDDEQIANQLKDRFNLIYIGDTGKRRGILTAFEMINLLKSSIPSIKLVLVGSSKEHHEYPRIVEEMNIQEHVLFTGWVKPELLGTYINHSQIGICPIHRNIHHNTTYANKIFQYMALGKPVIVSNCDAQKNLIEKYDSGLVFTDRNAQEFANCVTKLYLDKDFYQKQSINAEKAIKNELIWDYFSAPSLKNIYLNETD